MVFECSGNAGAAAKRAGPARLRRGVRLRRNGKHDASGQPQPIIVLEQTLIGAYNYDAEGFGPALDLLASGALPLDVLIESEDTTLDDIGAVMQRLASGEIAGKVLVRPELTEDRS